MSATGGKGVQEAPGAPKKLVPFMRDVFTIPTSARDKPRLIGSMCPECEEYFFPKTGAKPTCDNPVCPRSTSEVYLSGKGRLLSATVTRFSGEGGGGERASAVILLEEGIKINSHLVGWEGFRDMLVPGSPVELVLQEMGENEAGETLVGYAFRLITGRRKPRFPQPEPPAPPKEKAPPKREPAAAPAPPPAPAKAAAAKPKPKPKPKKKPKPKPKKKAAKKKVAKRAKKKAAKRKAAKKKSARKKTAARQTARRGAKGRAPRRKASSKKTAKKTKAKARTAAKKKTAKKKTAKRATKGKGKRR